MKINIQATALRFVALGLAAVMVVFAIGGIQAIARVEFLQTAPDAPTFSQEFFPPSESPIAWEKPTQKSPASQIPTAEHPVPNYTPRVVDRLAHPTNYGDRVAVDIFGRPVHNAPIVVLHETVGSASSAINTFQTAHPDENNQVSYHALIQLDGTIVQVVPPDKRAFGAGNSIFNGANGPEFVRTHRLFPGSVNNFAYHISLETPPDGRNNASGHSGYTAQQYQSLAWLIARSTVPDDRITTHRAVDRTGSRIDPRSFNAQQLFTRLHEYPRSVGG